MRGVHGDHSTDRARSSQQVKEKGLAPLFNYDNRVIQPGVTWKLRCFPVLRKL
jgi:hypothetical protein